MRIFNTKKSREEWNRKIEESYQRGKQDAEDEALSKESMIEYDENDLKKMTEKELLEEIIKSLNIQNKRTNNLNSKISFVMDYKNIFKKMNKIIDEIYNQQKLLSESIAIGQNQISELKSNVVSIKENVQEINKVLSTIVSTKSELSNILSEIEKIIPGLEEECNNIESIAKNMNDTILKYKDSPVELIYKIDKKIGIDDNDMDFHNLNSSIEDIEFKIDGIETELDESNFSKLNDIEYKVNKALDQYGYDSLYRKIKELSDKIDDIKFNNNNSY